MRLCSGAVGEGCGRRCGRKFWSGYVDAGSDDAAFGGKLWEMLGHKDGFVDGGWPAINEELAKDDEVEIPGAGEWEGAGASTVRREACRIGDEVGGGGCGWRIWLGNGEEGDFCGG